MSSKKAQRKKRRAAEQEERRKGVSPAWLFIIGIGLAVGATVGISMLFGGSSAPGEPPWPGAVWSEPHGHWH